MSEFEIKLQVPPDRLPAVQAALARGRTTRQRLRARYFDTAEGTLAQQRIVLRLRQEGRRWVQTAKAAGDNALHRLEHEVPVLPREASRPRLERHAGTELGERLAQALGTAGPDPDACLVEQYRIDVTRTTRVLHWRGTQVELALDVGRIACGRRHVDVCELELELKRGRRAVAVELAQRWCLAHGLWLDLVSKSERARQLAAAEAQAAPRGFRPPQLRSTQTAPALARAAALSALDQVLFNASAIASGAYGQEHVHQMRVGLRRLRTAARELAELGPVAEPGELAALTGCFRALGEHRDATWVEPLLLATMQADGAPAGLHLPPGPATDPASAVRSAAVQSALMGLMGRLAGAEAEADFSGLAPQPLLQARLSALLRRLRRDARSFDSLPLEAQHALRKRLKRLRYLAEVMQSLFPARKVAAFLAQARPLQDALGEYQDCLTALEAWQPRTAGQPEAWFAIGWLQARRRIALEACVTECRRFRKAARPFWK